MNLAIGIAIVTLVGLIALFQWRVARKAKEAEGQSAPPLSPEMDARMRERGKVLLYFFSPTCGACRAITPHVDKLAATHDNVFKVDISQSVELARQMNIRGTPTTLVVADGKFSEIRLGPISAAGLAQMLG